MKLPSIPTLLLVAAAASPLLRPTPVRHDSENQAPEFPTTIAGRTLVPVAPGDVEAAWLADFPGRIGRFHDGERTWILRSVTSPTLSLHSSSRCLEAAGFRVTALSAWRDPDGGVWSRVSATRDGRNFVVRERVSSLSSAASWPDVDAWRWDAWLGRDPGPWLAASAIESGTAREE